MFCCSGEIGNDEDRAVGYREIDGIVNGERVAGESETKSDENKEHEEDEMGAEYWVHVEGASDNDDDELQRIREIVKEIKKNKKSGFDRRPTSGSYPIDFGDGLENVESSHRERTLNFGAEGNTMNDVGICKTCLDEGKEILFSSDDEEFVTDSEDDDNVKRGTNPDRKRYDPSTAQPHFDLDMIFISNKQFKKAVVKHAILGKRDVKFKKDEKHRCRAVCKDPDCAWTIFCSIESATMKWVVKTFCGIHTCEQQLNESLFKYKVIVEYLKNDVGKLSLKMNNDDMKKHAKSKLGLDITMRQCRCAKKWSKSLHGFAETNHSELAAFTSYALAFPNSFLALVDTYDVMRSGIPNFCAVALALNDLGYKAGGIRLDSGDLAYLSSEVRKFFLIIEKEFAVNGFGNMNITASNDLNEETLDALNKQGHEVDSFGIGTNLVTCYAQAALGCVFKLVEINDQPRIKLSEDVSKVSIPCKKRCYRLYGKEGYALVDIMTGENEESPKVGERLLCRHPFYESKRAYVVPQKVEELLKCYWSGSSGIAYEVLPPLKVIRERCMKQLDCMRPDHMRRLNPTPYKVSVSAKLYDFIHFLWLNEAPVGELL